MNTSASETLNQCGTHYFDPPVPEYADAVTTFGKRRNQARQMREDRWWELQKGLRKI